MRKRDLQYYFNTIKLRLHGMRFNALKKNNFHQALVERKREEYINLLKKEIEIPFGNSQEYYTYATLSSFPKDLGPKYIFADAYEWEDNVPKGLNATTSFNPLLPFYYGMLLWNEWIHEKKYKRELIAIADMMMERIEYNKLGAVLRYDVAFKPYQLEKGFISGITQGLACSYYTRMYSLTGDNKYQEVAAKLFNPMLEPKEKGGLLISTNLGLEWVEEYPSSPPSYVLNGFIFSIISAFDMYQSTGEATYKFYFDSWIKTLANHLIDYQYKHYVLHNKYQNRLSNLEYQGLYVGQFLHLAIITKSFLFYQFFLFYYENCPWDDFYKFYGLQDYEENQRIHQYYMEARDLVKL